MDEMVFQCNNQNSIYVLNSNYGIPAPAATATTAHGEFRGLGLIDAPSGCRATSLIGSGLGSGGSSSGGLRDGDVCSTVSRSLQDKLKNLGNFNGALLFGGNNGTAAATTTYSPASSSYAAYPLGNSSNNNSNTGNSSAKSILHPNNGLKKCNVIGGGGGGGGGGPTSTGNMNGVVKSNLIAKKTKFWKYLEEEKLRNEVPPPPPRPSASHCSVKDFASCTDCYSPTDAIVCADGNCCDNSCVNKSTAMAPAPDASQFSSQHHQQQQSNNNKEYHQQQQQQQQQYTSNNWSRNHDSNNLKPQQQQQQQTLTQKSKEAAEMYKEAAELLGLTCTLCDNCRCLDCQSGYFDCDDSDSYSEFSLMDEYDVDDLDIVDIVVGGGAAAGCSDDYGAAQNMSAAAAYANSSTTTHKLLAMHADNMTALCCDILHSQQAATYERQAVDEDEGAAFCLPSAMPEGEVGGRFVVDEEDASRRISATVMTGMHQLEQQRAAGSRAEGPGTSSGTDEMNTAAITSASSSRISSDGPTEPTIDQVALHNIKGTMLPQATDAAAAARPTPPTTNSQGMAKGCGVRGNDLENCSNFDGLRLSDSYGPGARR